MKYKVIIYQELEVPNVSNIEEASNVAFHILQDQLEHQSIKDVFSAKFEEVIEYSPSADPILDNDRKVGKAKVFIKNIMEVCKKYDMVIISNQFIVASVNNLVHQAHEGDEIASGDKMEDRLLNSINVNNINL